MEEENWKDVFGYEGLYQISDQGRVKSLSYGLLTPARDKDGYLQFIFTKKGKGNTILFIVLLQVHSSQTAICSKQR